MFAHIAEIRFHPNGIKLHIQFTLMMTECSNAPVVRKEDFVISKETPKNKRGGFEKHAYLMIGLTIRSENV